MGFAVTWCAVPEKDADAFLARLRLKPTGKWERTPESLVSTTRLDTEWRLVRYNRYECPFLDANALARISKDHLVLVCRVEEHAMASSSEFWIEGRCHWCIEHRGEDGPKGLLVYGSPPGCFPAIKIQMEEAQRVAGGDEAGVNYLFEVPLKVAQAITGFKHDEGNNGVTDGRYAVLSDQEGS